jgi:hypothetical protein
LVSIPAALVNLGNMVVWIEVAEGWTDVNKLLGDPLRPFLLAFSIAHLITALGLSLLILLVEPLLSRVSKQIVTIPAFVICAGLLGAAAFSWSPEPYLFAACGAVSALICAIVLPNFIRPISLELA